jgi:nucleoside-diphosphate-sugar epimerase
MTAMARVLITGTSSGIGRAAAAELAARGHDVIATARRPEALAGMPVAQALRLDVTDHASVDAAVTAAGPLDAVVLNAGETIRGSVEATPLSEYQRLLDLNFLGALRVAKAVLPGFRQRRAGRIVVVSSILGRLAIPMISGYAAASSPSSPSPRPWPWRPPSSASTSPPCSPARSTRPGRPRHRPGRTTTTTTPRSGRRSPAAAAAPSRPGTWPP